MAYLSKALAVCGRGASYLLVLALAQPAACGGRTDQAGTGSGTSPPPGAAVAGAPGDDGGAGDTCSVWQCDKPEDCCSGVCHRLNPDTEVGVCSPCLRYGQPGCSISGTIHDDGCCSDFCSHEGTCLKSGIRYRCGSDYDCGSGFCWLRVGECLDTECDPRVNPSKVTVGVCENFLYEQRHASP